MPLLDVNLHFAPRRRLLLFFAGLLIVAAVTALLALSGGPASLSPREALAILWRRPEGINTQIILELRLPRVISGFVIGALLAVAGALMQVLLRNPLAEPYVLGISGGAAAFTLAAVSVGLGGAWLTLGAALGALLTLLAVLLFSHSMGGWNPLRVLLAGVVIAAGWGAVISFLLALSPAARLHGMLFWLMGDLSFSSSPGWLLFLLPAALILSMLFARDLNLLAAGDLQAAALGISVNQLRLGIYLLASLLTAAAVVQAGSIGFVGLIVPHALRLLIGNDNRLLLPAAALAGGALLMAADALARLLLAPRQLPVGVLTAMIGVPVFLVLLRSTAARQTP